MELCFVFTELRAGKMKMAILSLGMCLLLGTSFSIAVDEVRSGASEANVKVRLTDL